METMKKKPIHVSVDENLKHDAEQLFDELGLNMTTAITVFLKQSVTKQALPFKIEKGNPITLQAIKDVKDGNVYGGFSSIDDLMEDLDA
ncbi:type II toxin-antitoxin system RelB/DinJ family antitoxin [Enterococcus faecium]|uniref:type II toxin-antitoxin system RelB/DinJ family antitoxin n=1 Tax=Enterococcus faecium TaxID=1352 RepID=UPI000CF0C000|nr:type II toxin-antitoxin system RelB/DinJ family antitoxin [Enterococcus faecium]EGP4917839.1 type II toxin-antitoxin system RelB/DinJ family antitoxin [Enterococcus faecium]EGP5747301.1 type II toxin-antitoxin system RelB/DinJ family antitoxin [Enterococcus faecium]EMF0334006.1 type II toxin-antitoxin system RelB/DinJ family antitoxin [Enterococcus faecium]EMF0364876.1 type II toxin-antitoxin system RelB/DinJ family antitoxin [Enterococcus faecium]EMF0419028.1 type II toxin-antitoxin system